MIKNIKKNLTLLLILIFSLSSLDIAKADKVDDLKKIDQMYKEGFINIKECITLKTPLTNYALARRACNKLKNVQKIENSINKKKEATLKKGFSFDQFKKIFNFDGYKVVYPKQWGNKGLFGALLITMGILAYLIFFMKDNLNNYKTVSEPKIDKTKIKKLKKTKPFLSGFFLAISSLFSQFLRIINSYFTASANNIKNTSAATLNSTKNLQNRFQFNSKTLVVPCLVIIIGFLAIDKFGSFNFFHEDEYKNVNVNNLSKSEKMVYKCVKNFGFKKGSNKFNDCVFKLFQNDLEVQRMAMEKKIAQERLVAQQRANEAQQRAQQTALAQAQAQRENTLRQLQAERSAAAWSELGAIGLKLMQGPQTAPTTRTRCSMIGAFMNCTTR